ncbi:MAG TPA: hypothetical protein VF498_08735, partial [Anaerolineales bacterium]
MCKPSWEKRLGSWLGPALPTGLRLLVVLAVAGPALACASLPTGGTAASPVAPTGLATGLAPVASTAASASLPPVEAPPASSATRQPSPPAGRAVYFPAILKQPCDHHSASLELEASSASLAAGQSVTVTATLHNTGCLGLGLPQYRLSIEAPQAVLTPTHPSPVVHSLGVAPVQAQGGEGRLLHHPGRVLGDRV